MQYSAKPALNFSTFSRQLSWLKDNITARLLFEQICWPLLSCYANPSPTIVLCCRFNSSPNPSKKKLCLQCCTSLDPKHSRQ